MSSDNDRSYFREQAEYCLLEGQKASDPKDKEAWLKVADHWLQLALGAEPRKRDNPL